MAHDGVVDRCSSVREDSMRAARRSTPLVDVVRWIVALSVSASPAQLRSTRRGRQPGCTGLALVVPRAHRDGADGVRRWGLRGRHRTAAADESASPLERELQPQSRQHEDEAVRLPPGTDCSPGSRAHCPPRPTQRAGSPATVHTHRSVEPVRATTATPTRRSRRTARSRPAPGSCSSPNRVHRPTGKAPVDAVNRAGIVPPRRDRAQQDQTVEPVGVRGDRCTHLPQLQASRHPVAPSPCTPRAPRVRSRRRRHDGAARSSRC